MTGRLLAPGLVAVAFGVVGVVVGSPLVGVTGPLVAVLAWIEVDRRRRWRADLADAEALPAAIDQLIQELRSGASLAQACLGLDRFDSGPARSLRPLTDTLRREATMAEAVGALALAATDPSVRLVAATLEVLVANGGPAVPALRRLRHTLIGRAHRRRRAEAQAASALASAALLVAAPGLFALVLAAAEPDLARFYAREPLGAACATGSVGLSGIGWWWIHRAVDQVRVADG